MEIRPAFQEQVLNEPIYTLGTQYSNSADQMDCSTKNHLLYDEGTVDCKMHVYFLNLL